MIVDDLAPTQEELQHYFSIVTQTEGGNFAASPKASARIIRVHDLAFGTVRAPVHDGIDGIPLRGRRAPIHSSVGRRKVRRLIAPRVAIARSRCLEVRRAYPTAIGLTSCALRPANNVVEDLKVAKKPGKPTPIGQFREKTRLGDPFPPFASWLTPRSLLMAAMFGLQREIPLEGCVLKELRQRPGRKKFGTASPVISSSFLQGRRSQR